MESNLGYILRYCALSYYFQWLPIIAKIPASNKDLKGHDDDLAFHWKNCIWQTNNLLTFSNYFEKRFFCSSSVGFLKPYI